jgi:hypothetical protein
MDLQTMLLVTLAFVNHRNCAWPVFSSNLDSLDNQIIHILCNVLAAGRLQILSPLLPLL